MTRTALHEGTIEIVNAADAIALYTELMHDYDLPSSVVFNFPRSRHGFDEIPLLIIPSISIYIPHRYKNKEVHVEQHH